MEENISDNDEVVTKLVNDIIIEEISDFEEGIQYLKSFAYSLPFNEVLSIIQKDEFMKEVIAIINKEYKRYDSVLKKYGKPHLFTNLVLKRSDYINLVMQMFTDFMINPNHQITKIEQIYIDNGILKLKERKKEL